MLLCTLLAFAFADGVVRRAVVDDAAAVDASLAEDAEASLARQRMGYDQCPGSGCLKCPVQSIGRFARNWKLEPQKLNNRKQEKYTLTVYPKEGGEQEIPVRLPLWNPLSGEGGRGNCFAFATHRDYQTPAGTAAHEEYFGSQSPILRPHEVTPENFDEAMRREGAIFLGRDGDDFLEVGTLDTVPGRQYYIVAVFLTPGEEYHFWGLWNNGWYMVSSKISATVADLGYVSKPENLCPRSGIWAQMRAKNMKYNQKLGGIYLFPTLSTGFEWFVKQQPGGR